MDSNTSPAVQKLARQYVDGQEFSSPDDVLLFSLQLLGSFETYYQDHLGLRLRAAAEEMDNGQKTSYFNAAELKQYFDDVIQAGRIRASNEG